MKYINIFWMYKKMILCMGLLKHATTILKLYLFFCKFTDSRYCPNVSPLLLINFYYGLRSFTYSITNYDFRSLTHSSSLFSPEWYTRLWFRSAVCLSEKSLKLPIIFLPHSISHYHKHTHNIYLWLLS